MSRFKLLFSGFAVIAVAVWISGCSSKTKTTEKTTEKTTKKTSEKTGEKTGEGHGEHGDAGHEKIEKNLAKLPDEDRVLAEKQKTCPVTDAALGSMGMPLKVEAKGKTLFLCCGGCKKDFEKDPDKFLAKLK